MPEFLDRIHFDIIGENVKAKTNEISNVNNLTSPVPQYSGDGLLSDFFISNNITAAFGASHDFSLNYHVQENVKAATSEMIDWTNETISEIKNPTTNNTTQTWTTIDYMLADLYTAFDAVINSPIYNGNVSTINNTNTFNALNIYKDSKIDIYYNVDPVDSQNATINRYGSKININLD